MTVKEVNTPDDARKRNESVRTALATFGRTYGYLVLAWIGLVIYFAFSAQNFFTTPNFINILRHMSMLAIIGVGMTMVIISSEIDLSVGSLAAFSGVLIAWFAIRQEIPIPLAILLTLAFGALEGAFIGAIRVKFKIPTFITSLALFTALRSGAFLVSGGFPIAPFPTSFLFLGNGLIGPVPVPIIIMAVVYLVGYFLMAHTPWGRSIYAVGGNEEASHLSGINVAWTKISVFMVTGALAALAGIMLAARLGSGTPTVAVGWELEVIAAVIIGGTSLFGGSGTILGTLLGALLVATLNNGMVLQGVSPYAQGVVSGTVILLAVLLGSLQRRSAG